MYLSLSTIALSQEKHQQTNHWPNTNQPQTLEKHQPMT